MPPGSRTGVLSRDDARPAFDLDRTIDRLVTRPLAGLSHHDAADGGGAVGDHHRGQRSLQPAFLPVPGNAASRPQAGGGRGRAGLVARRAADRRHVPGHGLGGERDAAPHGHLLPPLHPVGGLRLPAPGGLQPGQLVQEGRSPRQAGAHHGHGLRMQRRRGWWPPG